jgi:hypothetical protein
MNTLATRLCTPRPRTWTTISFLDSDSRMDSLSSYNSSLHRSRARWAALLVSFNNSLFLPCSTKLTWAYYLPRSMTVRLFPQTRTYSSPYSIDKVSTVWWWERVSGLENWGQSWTTGWWGLWYEGIDSILVEVMVMIMSDDAWETASRWDWIRREELLGNATPQS